MIPKDRKILEGSGGPKTGGSSGIVSWQRATRSDRAPPGEQKARRSREWEAERANGDSRAVSKMQARSVDPAAGTRRKARLRRRRAKGRIEKQASTGTESGQAQSFDPQPAKLAAGNKMPTSRRAG